MGSDLARISYDRTRAYRSVILQQGRVTLEADANEASIIASEALRHETIDIIGPYGTPDNGYAVGTGSGPTDIVVGKGTMYLGGWRLTEPTEVHLNNQPDWQNLPAGSLDWKNLPPTQTQRSNFVIALLATEQSIGAVEDTALREVALGGPDSAARSRLMQHFLAVPVAASTCATAAKELAADLAFNGLTWHPKTAALTCGATLQVSFFPPTGTPDPCSPPAAGGYLGADNQLVRVTIAAYDPKTQTGTLLWGWNNASTLFRAAVAVAQTAATPATLTLSPAPVDAAHTPQQGQVIEVLRTECVLSDKTAAGYADQNFIAAPQGTPGTPGSVMVLPTATTAFNPDNNQLALPDLLPADYTTEPYSLFVRLWQAEVAFTSGQSAQLDDISGLAVTITVTSPTTALPSGAFITATPYWHFAVRPNTPEQVYPVRYVEGAQPPDGPRQWLCDLAVVTSNANGFTLLEDCRKHFLPLTGLDQSTCCGIVLDPAQVTAQGGLQAVLTEAAANQQSVSLRPGFYLLPAPLALTSAHDDLTLAGCGAGVALAADPKNIAAFNQGLITISGATGISLRQLALRLPQVPYTVPGADANTAAVDIVTMIGVHIDASSDITIADCSFDAIVGAKADAIAACIYAQGICSGLQVLGNTFDGGKTATPPSGIVRFTIGLWQSPAAQGNAKAYSYGVAVENPTFSAVNHQLDNAVIADNVFTGLTVAVVVIARLGLVRATGNQISECAGGLWFIESALGGYVAVGQNAFADEEANNSNANLAVGLRNGMQPAALASTMTYAGLLGSTAPAEKLTLSDEARKVLVANLQANGSAAYAEITRSLAPSAPASVGGAVAGAAAAPQQVDPALKAQTDNAFTMLSSLSVSVEQIGTTLQPTLYLLSNDLQLVAYATAKDAKLGGPSLPGLLAISTQAAAQGNIFVQGNRVQVPTLDSIAMVTFWAARTVVTGNQFFQLLVQDRTALPCAIAITDDANYFAISGNIVHASWLIYPHRSVTAQPTTWEFLNTVG